MEILDNPLQIVVLCQHLIARDKRLEKIGMASNACKLPAMHHCFHGWPWYDLLRSGASSQACTAGGGCHRGYGAGAALLLMVDFFF
jgi:hypothetical protein